MCRNWNDKKRLLKNFDINIENTEHKHGEHKYGCVQNCSVPLAYGMVITSNTYYSLNGERACMPPPQTHPRYSLRKI